MGLLKGTLNRADLADCDLIIEAIFEDMAIKKEIFADLDKIAKPGAILASNTSYLDINEIASVTKRPQDVIGLHFFSPANVMKLLEIVRAKHTSDEVVATSMDLAKKIGKVAALAGVCPGFIGNRMLARRQQAAGYLVQAGAMPWTSTPPSTRSASRWARTRCRISPVSTSAGSRAPRLPTRCAT